MLSEIIKKNFALPTTRGMAKSGLHNNQPQSPPLSPLPDLLPSPFPDRLNWKNYLAVTETVDRKVNNSTLRLGQDKRVEYIQYTHGTQDEDPEDFLFLHIGSA